MVLYLGWRCSCDDDDDDEKDIKQNAEDDDYVDRGSFEESTYLGGEFKRAVVDGGGSRPRLVGSLCFSNEIAMMMMMMMMVMVVMMIYV